MIFKNIIKKKRAGEKLNREEINFFVKNFTDGKIPDYQASALLMAICINGMDEEETKNLTFSMIESGKVFDFSNIKIPLADKHSTGGVGDKTTFIVTPLFATMGGAAIKMSGRGLGHTGGTADKIESIPGIKISLSEDEIINQIEKIGACMITQSENIALADKKIYALRDATETVDSIPLIASSIMSKKIACGSDVIVLDVKFGNGAFMKTKEQAEKLAKVMIKIGKSANKKVSAILSDMNQPLGNNVGNSLEIIEAVNVLKNQGDKRLEELSVNLAAKMYSLSFNVDFEKSILLAKSKLEDLSAYNKFCEIINFQNGDISYLENTEKFDQAKYELKIYAKKDGYIDKIETEQIGNIALMLGAGRKSKEDEINLTAGLVFNKKIGDKVNKGDLFVTLYSDNEKTLKEEKDEFLQSIHLSREKTPIQSVIYKILD